MAVRKGDFLSGVVGPMVTREVNGRQVVQSKPDKYTQTEGTKKSGKVFGKSSSLAGLIRNDFCRCHNGYCDSEMAQRSVSATRLILGQCYDKDSGIYQVKNESFNRLKGFEFNLKSLLIDFLWARPQLTLIADQLLIKLPKTKISTELKFPKGATSCIRKLMLTFYSPATGYYYANHLQLEPVLNIKGTIDAQEFNFTVPKGVICFLSMALEYHTESYGVSKVINNKQFNPAGICEILVNPGIFDIESPELQPQLRYWENDSKILLPGAVFLTEEEEVAHKDVQLLAKSKEAKPAKEKKADKQNEKEIRKAEAKSIAATLKNMGMDTAEIVRATGLSKKQVEEL